MKVLISLMCHPDREPAITIPPSETYEVYLNQTPNYGDAVRAAIDMAIEKQADLVIADSDGYHPVAAICDLAYFSMFPPQAFYIIKPSRQNIGFQSWAFSLLYSLVFWHRYFDATGGLYRISYSSLPKLRRLLKTDDMTIQLEILEAARIRRVPIVQYDYHAGENDKRNSKRTKHYQYKLLQELLGGFVRRLIY